MDEGLGIPAAVASSPKPSGSDSDDDESSQGDSDSDSQSSSSSTSSKRTLANKSFTKSLASSRSKPPAWTDPSDVQPTAKVSLLTGPTRLRKLRHAVDEDEITGREYETRLREQFERINPEPSWAKKSRKKGKGKDGDEEDNVVESLLSSTTGILAEKPPKGRKHVVIPQGALSIERVRDANHSVQGSGSGEVKVLTFHPKPSVPVLCVATADRRVRLFNVRYPSFSR